MGTDEDPKMVKISVHVDGQFKEDLRGLLMEFKDVFAWEYFEMKGIKSALHQHIINLKQDAVPVVQQRYKTNPKFAK